MTNRDRENKLRITREDINDNLLECYNLICTTIRNKNKPEKKTIQFLIKKHKKFINKTNIGGRAKYNTLDLLIHYFNTSDPVLAIYTLTNSLNNRKIFNNNT